MSEPKELCKICREIGLERCAIDSEIGRFIKMLGNPELLRIPLVLSSAEAYVKNGENSSHIENCPPETKANLLDLQKAVHSKRSR